jgi:serine/threonine protein kinase
MSTWTPGPHRLPGQLPSIEELLDKTPYELVRKLGAGGIGEVHVVRARAFHRHFALKVLHPHFAARPSFVSRMRREAKAMGQLQHRHVVEIIDFWIPEDGRPCIVMELLHGRNLADELLLRRPFPPEEAVEWACQALDALHAAHELGLVHRDLKLENLYLHQPVAVPGRILKVLDFGFVQMIDAGWHGPVSLRTQSGTVLGTRRFMSPEQARGEQVDRRTDLFALGAVLYTMLTGRGPLDTGEEPFLPSRLARGIPPALDAVVMRAIQTEREERYDTAQAMRDELQALAPDLPSTSAR